MANSSPKGTSPAPASPGSPTEAPAPIAIDPLFEGEDDDPTLDEGAFSTASVTSTIFEYRKLHGRTFHNFKDAEYWGPNDESQGEGEDLSHHMLYLALGDKLFFAPLDKPQQILDVGAGTGLWAMDMADQFPEAEVRGIDLSPIQPAWVPPNCRFEIDDAAQEWTFQENTFDYIHIRTMAGSFKDWVKLYSECYRCLKPGGILEHQDFSIRVQADDGSIPPDSMWKQWEEVFTEVGDKLGQTFEVVLDGRQEKWMEEAGFRGVQSQTFKTAVGGWPADKRQKEIGVFNRLSLEMGLEGYALYCLTKVLGWEYEAVQVWLAKVRQTIQNMRYHAYTTWGVAWAQKPKV